MARKAASTATKPTRRRKTASKKKAAKPLFKPTRAYAGLDAAYTYFNRRLFKKELPRCLITFQRRKGSYGYFSGDRFAKVGAPKEVADEIALNPTGMKDRSPTAVLATLVHEMVHCWQHHYGDHKRARSSYHTKEWAAKMRAVGLIPTDTGELDGKETGWKVTHVVEEGGRFEQACEAFLEKRGEVSLYHDQPGDKKAKTVRKGKAASKTKYQCPVCKQNAWAKPRAHLVCGFCEEIMSPLFDHAEEPPAPPNVVKRTIKLLPDGVLNGLELLLMYSQKGLDNAPEEVFQEAGFALDWIDTLVTEGTDEDLDQDEDQEPAQEPDEDDEPDEDLGEDAT
jgi:predicted SprT family Zn-dependent metalloprotease